MKNDDVEDEGVDDELSSLTARVDRVFRTPLEDSPVEPERASNESSSATSEETPEQLVGDPNVEQSRRESQVVRQFGRGVGWRALLGANRVWR